MLVDILITFKADTLDISSDLPTFGVFLQYLSLSLLFVIATLGVFKNRPLLLSPVLGVYFFNIISAILSRDAWLPAIMVFHGSMLFSVIIIIFGIGFLVVSIKPSLFETDRKVAPTSYSKSKHVSLDERVYRV